VADDAAPLAAGDAVLPPAAEVAELAGEFAGAAELAPLPPGQLAACGRVTWTVAHNCCAILSVSIRQLED